MIAIDFHAEHFKLIKGSNGAAGFDVSAAEGLTLWPYWMRLITGSLKPQLVKTGLKWAPESRLLYMQLLSRSGMAVKQNVHVVAGVVDADYRGEIMVALDHRGLLPFKIASGDRIAQAVIHSLPDVELKYTDEVDVDTTRGEEGFGSTGA